jgi:hypothetical protein
MATKVGRAQKGVKLVEVQRGGIKTAYQAGIEFDGVRVGYVQRERGDGNYRAFAGGKRVSNGRTLNDVKEDLRVAGQAGELSPEI